MNTSPNPKVTCSLTFLFHCYISHSKIVYFHKKAIYAFIYNCSCSRSSSESSSSTNGTKVNETFSDMLAVLRNL